MLKVSAAILWALGFMSSGKIGMNNAAIVQRNPKIPAIFLKALNLASLV